jgi:hypothetical protein
MIYAMKPIWQRKPVRLMSAYETPIVGPHFRKYGGTRECRKVFRLVLVSDSVAA